MTTRWWAPAAPRVGPDAFDLLLLEAGSDSRLDLANAVVAYHRVGAAACEAAKDERQLVDNLIRARAVFAPAMTSSVSKCVTEGDTYAGLLVRDVADDAEQAALDLYRQAVAKGVTSTLAAQRVGAVFGVPAVDLGGYRALACTPAASPVAIADAADKALFTYVEKVCDEEWEAPYETVSKATDTEEETGLLTRAGGVLRRATSGVLRRQTEDDPETPYYDARDDGGRFKSSGVLRRKELGQGQSAPAAIGVRGTRKTRKTRSTAVTEAATRPAAQRKGAKNTKAAKRTAAQRLATAKNTAEAVTVEPDYNGNESWADIADAYEIMNSHRLGQELTMFLSLDELTMLQQNALGDPNRNRVLFRLGHLRDAIEGKIVPSDDTVEALGEAQLRIEDDLQGDLGPMPLDPITLDYGAPEAAVQEAKDKLVDAYAEMIGVGRGDPRYRDLMGLAQEANDFGYERKIIYLTDPAEQGVVEVHQLVLEDPYGIYLKTSSGGIKLDPNQGYALDAQQIEFIENDPDNGKVIKIVQHIIKPVSDQDISHAKYDTGRNGRVIKADDVLTPYFDNRAANGQFATEDDDTGVLRRTGGGVLQRTGGILRRRTPETVATRGVRAVRRTRISRDVERPGATRSAAAERKGATRTDAAKTTAAVTRAAAQWDKVTPADFDIDEDTDYAVFGEGLADVHRLDMGNLKGQVLTADEVKALISQTSKGMQAVYEMANVLQDHHFNRHPVKRSMVPVNSVDPIPERRIRDIMERYLDQNPGVQHVVAYPDGPDGDFFMFRHEGRMAEPNVVEVPAGFDKTKPAILVDQGTQRSDTSVARSIDKTIPGTDTNFQSVKGLEVVRPTVRRWTLTNDLNAGQPRIRRNGEDVGPRWRQGKPRRG